MGYRIPEKVLVIVGFQVPERMVAEVLESGAEPKVTARLESSKP